MTQTKQNNSKQKFKNKQRVTGVIKRHPDGYGFFIPDDMNFPDVYIPKPSMEGVMSNDKVRVQVRPEGQRFRGNILEIVSRGTKNITGKLHIGSGGRGYVVDESFAWGEDLKVTLRPDMKVKEGDWVSVKINSYPDSIRGFQGEVIAVLGDLSNPENDNLRVLSQNSIPNEFSKACINLAESFPKEVTEADKKGRRNLVDKKFITIDGQTAKDFDDAVYVEKSSNGFHLYVAIADVSHYVKPGSPIDEDAYDRGTSTYFPGFVSPMLPEALSNELCSLKPNVERLAFVADMHIGYDGKLEKFKFYEAVIKSKARVTYGEAQEILDGKSIDKLQHVGSEIKLASDLAEILMKKRFKEGALNLDIPETTVEVDSGGNPVDIMRSERLFAHKLIEELMLVTNIAAAKFFDQNNLPGLYRVHEDPKPEAIEMLENFLSSFGAHEQFGQKNLQKRLTKVLERFKDMPQETIINILTLRSMNQAKYSANNIGHFGLGFDFYAHFTSPIRRYPDLIVHRLIKSVAEQNKGYRARSEEDLESSGVFLSACEQRSVKAERQIQGIKKARFMEKFLGQEFEGVISSVTKFGLFVLLRQFDVDGLVKIENLGSEAFDFDEEHMRLIAKRSGLTYSLGDPIRVQVTASDYQTGRIDFGLPSGEEIRHDAKSQNKKPTKERKSTKKNSQRVRKTRVSRSGGKSKAGSRSSRKNNSRRHK